MSYQVLEAGYFMKRSERMRIPAKGFFVTGEGRWIVI
jgi:hypothetical protein